MDMTSSQLNQLKEHLENAPGEFCLLSDDATKPSPDSIQFLQEAMANYGTSAGADTPLVLTCLSNHSPDFNPFAGVATSVDETKALELAPGLVALLGSGSLHEVNEWPYHVALLSPAAVRLLADPAHANAEWALILQAAGGRVLVADSMFVPDGGKPLFSQHALEPHEDSRPAAWADLTFRLDEWLQLEENKPGALPTEALRQFQSGQQSPSLHITHSWGGGIGQWVESFIEASQPGVNFQLCAEGVQNEQGCGQQVSLYLDTQLSVPVARWWLQPPIRSTTREHPEYREILGHVNQRYGVGRIIVSSLVGHSLEALCTGLPTVQVLHDFYPRWPLLGVHPEPYIESSGINLSLGLSDHRPISQLADLDAEACDLLASAWRKAVTHWGVKVAAPSRSVADLLRLMDPAWKDIPIEIIPHGLPEIPGSGSIRPRPREDDRLRILVPGRIQEGKGQKLLLQSLEELTPLAQITLLGSGKSGEQFFGHGGVDVIFQYDRDHLRTVLAEQGPHLALLLSIVPETFSYTLSEMQELGIPVIATRVGALEERITDGETGWLIEPTVQALVKKVRELAERPDRLEEVRDRLGQLDVQGTGRMVERYGNLCLPRPSNRQVATPPGFDRTVLAGLSADLLRTRKRLRESDADTAALKREVKSRTEWAEERERARKLEVSRREKWVAELQSHISKLDEVISDRDHQILVERQNHQRQLDELQSLHDWVLSTRSWRYTRPLRVLGRALSTLAHVRVWNPMRWPFLLSRLVGSLRTRGLRTTLNRTQADAWKPYRTKSVDTEKLESIGNPEPPPGLPFPASPVASIVIPVYNKWEYTAACLRSLVEHESLASFEVIVVDDQSSDETWDRLLSIDNVVAVRNEKNLGFVGSCNRGAESARGEYIVMLNNDTQVTAGWLDELLRTFDSHPDTGLAGARLVYPDGRLQEAGGLVFNDGSGWNYGKFDDPDRTDYQFVREVDYCSGACIALPTDLFRNLGGFDSDYAPAYYEDTDLAFKVRAAGLKVRVQPASSIIHHEGITSGSDLSSGAKRYQEINKKTFRRKWRDALESHPAPIRNPDDPAEIRRARDHHCKGRVLVIDAYTPEPDQDSGSVRLCYLMECLVNLGYRVSFMPDNRSHAGNYTRDLQSRGIETLYSPWVSSLQDFFSQRGGEFNFVFISRYYVANNYLDILKRNCPGARFIFDTVDLHYLREERLAELENSLPLKRAAAQTRRAELAVINAADATLVVSPVEKTILAESAPQAQVNVISNIHEVKGSQREFSKRKDIFFVGGYQHPPNIDAATWFVSSIWPLIRDEIPDLTFHLIGSKAPEQIRALDGNGVKFHGFVDSLEPWLDGCRLAVAPLRYGAGVKGKVNMSMSRGQPVVATPMAVEGMFAKPGKEVLVADSAEEFAADVVRLYRDEVLWNQISSAGLENVRRYFSVETARLGLQELLNSLS